MSLLLRTPYEISDDQPLYIGYYFLCNGKNEGYIPVDGYPSAEPGGLIATSAGSKWPGKRLAEHHFRLWLMLYLCYGGGRQPSSELCQHSRLGVPEERYDRR